MVVTVRQRFDVAAAQFVKEYRARDPVGSTAAGIRDYDSNLADTSAAGFAAAEHRARHWLRTFERFDARQLADAQRIDQQLVCSKLRSTLANADWKPWQRDAEAYLNDGTFELFMHGTRPEADAAAAAIARLAQVPQMLANGKLQLDASLASPILILDRALPTARAQAEFVRAELPTYVKDPTLRAQVAAAGAVAAQAYEQFADFLEDFSKRAHGSFAFGEKRYNSVLQQSEGLKYDARTLRDVGKAQFAQINAQMEDLAQEISGSSDWRALVKTLQDDRPASMDALLREYRAETARARQFVIDHGLMSVPSGDQCAVMPAPVFLRPMVSVASYFPAPAFGPAADGTFNVPFTPDNATPADVEQRLRSNARYMIPSVTAHEAYPGHHLHFRLAEQADSLRQTLTSTYFIEGWGLYVEKMMGDQGFYQTPAEHLGQLNMRLFRAARIIVDTSLHLGEMTFDDAVVFMSEQCGFPENTARGEVRRYAAWPTQASAYLTGAIEIERMRDEWLAQGKGTLREFNDAITSAGFLPPGIAEMAVGLAPVTAKAPPSTGLSAA